MSKHLNTTYFGQSYQGGFHIRDVDAAGCHCMNLCYSIASTEGISSYCQEVEVGSRYVPLELAL